MYNFTVTTTLQSSLSVEVEELEQNNQISLSVERKRGTFGRLTVHWAANGSLTDIYPASGVVSKHISVCTDNIFGIKFLPKQTMEFLFFARMQDLFCVLGDVFGGPDSGHHLTDCDSRWCPGAEGECHYHTHGCHHCWAAGPPTGSSDWQTAGAGSTHHPAKWLTLWSDRVASGLPVYTNTRTRE